MAAAVKLREDVSASELRALARRSRDARQSRRDRGELMAKRQELQLENRAPTEAVAEHKKKGEKDDCIHARDAIEPRSKTEVVPI